METLENLFKVRSDTHLYLSLKKKKKGFLSLSLRDFLNEAEIIKSKILIIIFFYIF